MDEILNVTFILQRYLDLDRNMVEFFGNVN